MKKLALTLFCFSAFLFSSCGSSPIYITDQDGPQVVDPSEPTGTKDPFGNIGLYKDPELAIDGVRNEEYDYPSGSGRKLVYEGDKQTTYVSIYKGEKAIYFLFECEDEDISTINVEDTNIVTAQSDSVELYLDTYGVGGRTRGSTQYEFRVTAAGRIYSYLNGFVAKVFTYGTLNMHKDVDQGWNVEGYISYDVLGSDVNKETPSSFAFARVTKTGSFEYHWNGAVDPQIPDNYLILYKDNKFYTHAACPLDGKIEGTLVDIAGNPVSIAKVTIGQGRTIMTNNEGYFSFDLVDQTENISMAITKANYVTLVKEITKSQIKACPNNKFIFNSVFLKESDSSYKTTLSGKIFERDGVTPISGAVVKVNDSQTTTDASGAYSFEANCNGYANDVVYTKDNHISYTSVLPFENVVRNGETAVNDVQLDESYGDEISFGNINVGFATARVVRATNSFKVVLKTDKVIDPAVNEGSNFEMFVDTKTTGSYNHRDETDFLLELAYRPDGLKSVKNYGNAAVPNEGVSTKYGRINELYFVEADIDYAFFGMTSTEIFGLYFGLKVNYNWAGMYEEKNGNYIRAENPANYYRVGLDSKFFIGSCNTIPSVTTAYVPVGEIGNFNGNTSAPKYDVSVALCSDGVMLKMAIKDGYDMLSQSHSFNVYVDMDNKTSKTIPDDKVYHISIYPGKPVSHYTQFNGSGVEGTSMIYEEDALDSWAYLYDGSIYVKISRSIFGGETTSTIAFALGCWNDTSAGNDILSYGGVEPEFDNPNTYIYVNSDGTVGIRKAGN